MGTLTSHTRCPCFQIKSSHLRTHLIHHHHHLCGKIFIIINTRKEEGDLGRVDSRATSPIMDSMRSPLSLRAAVSSSTEKEMISPSMVLTMEVVGMRRCGRAPLIMICTKSKRVCYNMRTRMKSSINKASSGLIPMLFQGVLSSKRLFLTFLSVTLGDRPSQER